MRSDGVGVGQSLIREGMRDVFLNNTLLELGIKILIGIQVKKGRIGFLALGNNPNI